jgi:hypothetical protein
MEERAGERRWVFIGFPSPRSSCMSFFIFLVRLKAEQEDGGAGAGALVVLWNRQHAFVGEPEPLTPCVRNSNR